MISRQSYRFADQIEAAVLLQLALDARDVRHDILVDQVGQHLRLLGGVALVEDGNVGGEQVGHGVDVHVGQGVLHVGGAGQTEFLGQITQGLTNTGSAESIID